MVPIAALQMAPCRRRSAITAVLTLHDQVRLTESIWDGNCFTTPQLTAL